MNKKPKTPIFLQRSNYRRRRLRDAARMVAFLGLILWLVPLLWPRDALGASQQSGKLLYIFGVWVALVCLAAGLSHRIWLMPKDDDAEGKPE